MILPVLALWCLMSEAAQDPAPLEPATSQPAPQEPAAQQPAPQAQPEAPAKEPKKPGRSRDDRLEGRIAGEPGAQPAAPVPAAEEPPKAAPPPAVDPLAGWSVLNACVLIVNEEPVTRLELLRLAYRRSLDQSHKKSSQESLFNDAIVERAKVLLKLQGGRDLGFDRAQVDRYVDMLIEKQTEKFDSVTQLATELKAEGIDSFERRDEVDAVVYQKLWNESMTGEGASPGGRPSRDDYVRPGLAQYAQREAVYNQARTRQVNATTLVLAIEGPEGAERARAKLEGLRERIVQGEDMGELSKQFSASKPPQTGFLQLDGLRISNPKVGEFLSKAEVGELSPVLDYDVEGKCVGYVLVRADEFKLTPVRPFDEREGQKYWIEHERDRIKDQRTNAGLMQLLQAAYVWPPNLFKAQ